MYIQVCVYIYVCIYMCVYICVYVCVALHADKISSLLCYFAVVLVFLLLIGQ